MNLVAELSQDDALTLGDAVRMAAEINGDWYRTTDMSTAMDDEAAPVGAPTPTGP